MKKTAKFLAILFACFILSCGTKSERNSEQSEQLEEQPNELEQLEEPVQIEEQPDQSTESEAMPEENISDPGARPADSINTYILRWVSISRDEYGAMYTFENKNEEDVRFFHLSIDEFSDSDNPYYIQKASEQSIMPVYDLKDEIKDKWFNVRVEKQLVEVDGLGESAWVDVITKIEPVR